MPEKGGLELPYVAKYVMFLVLSAVKEQLQHLISTFIDKVTTDVLFHITCFSSLLFLIPQRIASIKYIPQTSEDFIG